MTDEQWRPVPGYEDYLVSDLGRVMSLKWGRRRLMRLTPESDGYLKCKLWKNGVYTRGTVHMLVALVFHGPRPDGMQIRHLDGNKLNNRASNLAYGTPSENSQDTVAHGSHHWARKTHCPSGHEYTPENTSIRSGRRHCRECHRNRHRRKAAA